MGLTYVSATAVNPANPRRQAELRFLVDSGALFTVMPRDRLKALGVKPVGFETVVFSEGRRSRWKKGEVVIAIDGKRGTSPVLFGERGTTPLLGVVSLEILGLALNPRTRKLSPVPVIVA